MSTRSDHDRPRFTPRIRRLAVVLALAVGLALMVPASASARDSAARKFGRGLSNVSLGILAVPGQMMKTGKERGPFVAATWGLVKGVGVMVATEMVGLYEVVTCPFQTPPDYKPILKPEFPWQYFSGDPRANETRSSSPRRAPPRPARRSSRER